MNPLAAIMSAHPTSTTASRYLANQLSDAERTDYEALLTNSTEALAELEATARLKVGLERLREEQEIPVLLRRPSSSRWTSWLPLAAGVAALCIGTALWRSDRAAPGPLFESSMNALVDVSGHPLRITATTALYRKRTGVLDAVIELPPARGILEWRSTASPGAEPQRYSVVLSLVGEDETLRTVGAIDGLIPDNDGVIKWYTDTSRLIPGRYKLTLRKQSQRGQPAAPETFLINIRMGAKK
jgi:hypothetical protein